MQSQEVVVSAVTLFHQFGWIQKKKQAVVLYRDRQQ